MLPTNPLTWHAPKRITIKHLDTRKMRLMAWIFFLIKGFLMHSGRCIQRRYSIHFGICVLKQESAMWGGGWTTFLSTKPCKNPPLRVLFWTTFMVRITALSISNSIWANFLSVKPRRIIPFVYECSVSTSRSSS